MSKRPEWHYRQSAALPYRRCADGVEVLLITSRKGKRWLIPKGIIEPEMTPSASAAKEAEEEAGVEGEVWTESLGSYAYRKWGGVCTVEVFPMEVTVELQTWPEATVRQRAWIPIEAALDRIEDVELARLVLRLPAMIENDTKAPGRD
jgi:8-oxo-dGTP pyrophosphatase MutT (NUDIX family)